MRTSQTRYPSASSGLRLTDSAGALGPPRFTWRQTRCPLACRFACASAGSAARHYHLFLNISLKDIHYLIHPVSNRGQGNGAFGGNPMQVNKLRATLKSGGIALGTLMWETQGRGVVHTLAQAGMDFV